MSWCGYGMDIWKKFYHQNVEDFASLILQYTYSIATINDFLNIKNIDMHRRNIIFKHKPCKGKYRLIYVISKDCDVVFQAELKTDYIFTLIDWATIDISDYNRPINPLIAKVISRDRRSTSNSSSISEYSSNFNLFSNLFSFWMNSMEYYFPSRHLLNMGLDIRNLSFLINGADEWMNIVQKLSEILNNKDILDVSVMKNLSEVADFPSPSFNYFDVKMYIQWEPHIINKNISSENKKKRGRPRKYKSNAEKQRIYRIKKNRKKYESAYDVPYNEFEIFNDAYKVVDIFQYLQSNFTTQCVLDTDLIRLEINDATGFIGAFANKTIHEGINITTYEGTKSPTATFDNLFMLKISNTQFIHGIRYPLHLHGAASLIQRSSERDNNVIFVEIGGKIWAKSNKIINKDEELVAPLTYIFT